MKVLKLFSKCSFWAIKIETFGAFLTHKRRCKINIKCSEYVFLYRKLKNFDQAGSWSVFLRIHTQV